MSGEYFPEVVQALVGPDQTVYAYFSDGRITRVDMKPLISAGGVFSCLASDDFFSGAITVLNGTVAWDVSGVFDPTQCIDLDPFTVYAAERVSDPLESVA
ncbi:DUF2442 domain-containing protein [Paratractidigestivibacter sp.]|uniref:DUF2442 domain-containing protein n=1 Tax=Paratractidigestivibacter sp. TaxID=2847316 RepID=UPI002ABE6957|nr:DUF2442 domain-containing protein [Paratractidigestivibacter sp.]